MFQSATTWQRILFCIVCSLIAAITVWLPLANLISKIGWEAKQVDDGIQRSWSIGTAWHAIVSTSSFSTEISWSVQLAFWSTLCAMLLAYSLVAMDRNRVTTAIFGTLLGFALALPGPLVNLIVMKIFDSNDFEWIHYLADRTLLEPIIALQFRCLPIGYLLVWSVQRVYMLRYSDLLRLEADQSIGTRLTLWLRYAATPTMVMTAILFFVAFAELSCYLLVQPPGVTTVAMRMFDLLHYGIRNREASLALMLALVTALPIFALMTWWLKRDASHL